MLVPEGSFRKLRTLIPECPLTLAGGSDANQPKRKEPQHTWFGTRADRKDRRQEARCADGEWEAAERSCLTTRRDTRGKEWVAALEKLGGDQ